MINWKTTWVGSMKPDTYYPNATFDPPMSYDERKRMCEQNFQQLCKEEQEKKDKEKNHV